VNIQTPSRRVAIVALLSVAAVAGRDNPAQPITPTDSTVEERRPDEVPEGNVVVPPAGTQTPNDSNPATSSDG
jgi:hypothetical protein